MLSDKDYLEATRRFKNKKDNAHARQRYHALLLVTKGYSYLETADILFVDEGTISRWASLYHARGLDGLKNHPQWGGEHGQRPLAIEELARLSTLLEAEAMPGTEVGSGWTVKAIRDLIAERFEVSYCRRAVRKLLRAITGVISVGASCMSSAVLKNRHASNWRLRKCWPNSRTVARR
jgi:transposase